MTPPPDPSDRSRPLRVVSPGAPAADEDREQVINLRIGWRQSARVKTFALLLGAASAPAGVLAGVVPWGMRAAGLAMKTDLDAMTAKVEAVTKSQQLSDDLAIKRSEAITKALEVQTANVSTLKADVRALTRKLTKRPARAEMDDRP